jgi:hypothetical protein
MTKRPDPLAVTPAHVARATRWPIGTAVTVTRDDAAPLETTTRSGPWRRGGTWVLMVEGITAGVALARITERSG